jgi:hypothetical protein
MKAGPLSGEDGSVFFTYFSKHKSASAPTTATYRTNIPLRTALYKKENEAEPVSGEAVPLS